MSLEQADGTAWMASYCLNMAWAAVELALEDPAYEDMAVKFLEHYLAIAAAMNGLGGEDSRLWDEEDGFYYDFVRRSDGERIPLKLRSLVGLLPIFPAMALTESARQRLSEQAPYFTERMRWYGEHHPELASLFPERQHSDGDLRRVFTLVPEDRLRRVLARMFDPNEFLSDYGIRSLSRYYLDHPFELRTRDQVLTVKYEPAESSTGMFGGNSNWRGPIWMPANLTLIAGLRNLHRCFGDDFLMEYPTGSGRVSSPRPHRRRYLTPSDLDLPARTGRSSPRLRRNRGDADRPALERRYPLSTSTSTATTAPASAPVTRLAGPPSSLTSSTALAADIPSREMALAGEERRGN